MRLIFFSLCLVFTLGNGVQAAAQATYRHIPADVQALACSDPTQEADCKMYFAGFAHTIDLMLATDPSTKGDGDGVCGDITDLVTEFAHEVQTNPKAHKAETHMVLFGLLAGHHNCAKVKGRIQNHVTAGNIIDMCHAGDTGFNLCSQYQAGFLSAVLFVSEQTGKPILCGDQRLIDPVSVSTILNNRLQANFRLRRDPAVAVMLNELKANMPCGGLGSAVR